MSRRSGGDGPWTRAPVLVFALIATAFFLPWVRDGAIPLPTDLIRALLENKNVWAGEARVQNTGLSDPVCQTFPFFRFAATERSEGRIPRWVPYVSCGCPHAFAPSNSPMVALARVLEPVDAYALSLWLQLVVSGLRSPACSRRGSTRSRARSCCAPIWIGPGGRSPPGRRRRPRMPNDA